MDMWEPYVQYTLEAVPLAASKIVYDRFHIVKHMTEAVDIVRTRQNRSLAGDADDRLKRTKYLGIASKKMCLARSAAKHRYRRRERVTFDIWRDRPAPPRASRFQ